MMEELLSLLRSAWTDFLLQVAHFLPRLLAVLIILLAGWGIAALVRAVVRRVLGWVRFNALLERAGTGALLSRAGAPMADQIVGSLIFWLIWLAFLLSGLRALGIAGAEALATDFLRFVPRLLVALLVLVGGFALANFLWRVVLLAAVNARIPQAPLLGALVRVLVIAAAVAMALEQVGMAETVVQTAFAIFLGSVMLSAAIAFGLGGRHLARRFLEEKLLAPPRERDAGGPSHL
jgi:hypothetical protein